MSMNSQSAGTPVASSQPERKHDANRTPDPWHACALLEYGGDRSFAWAVRAQVIDTTPESRPQIEDRLLGSLALPGCTAAGRALLCEMLALIGSAKSVPPLGALLLKAESSDAARFALESIPGPEVDAALRAALNVLTDENKAGLMGTIAVRRDRAAHAAIAAVKGNSAEPALVREAASRALLHLANSKP
jgi:hypothetical protein